MPKYFNNYLKTGCKKCLKLKKTLYGLCQSLCAFWGYSTKMLEACSLKQSYFDPFIFVREKVLCIVIVYVDDLILWSRNDDNIHDLAM